MQNLRVFISLLAVAAAAACTTEKIVYRSGTNFAAPPDAAANFIGYSDETSKQTVCGSCHVDIQTRWSGTKHASAWATLQANSGKATYCEACHSVGSLGNASTDANAGYGGTKDARYHDVQCESCHGAGLTHASAPNASNRPLASIQADTGLKNGCGECHSGVHNPFLDEWKLSGHSKTNTLSSSIPTDPYCQSCHTAQGAILAMGSTENYVEKNGPFLPAVCATCHDPHGSANGKQLRLPLSGATIDGNLCAKCHQRRADPSQVTTRNSVHSPEGPTLFGLAGWFPPGMSASDSIVGTHGSTAKNPNLCATCHVQRFTVTDKATGKFVFQSTGHRFLATPCVDANGQPTVDQSCTVSAQSFRSCVSGSCHGTENVARSAFNTAQARITNLQAEVTRVTNLVKAGTRKADCTFPNPVYTSCLGAAFNLSLSQKAGSFVHNPFLIEQLLIASINQMKKDYGVTVSAGLSLEPLFKKNHEAGAVSGGAR
jgi:predicted CXXCH cytochrome family protein